MVKDIDALNERLKDPNETFTADEAQRLVDWHVKHAMTDQYQQTRVASILQESQDRKDKLAATMDKLLSLWDETPMQPDLVEVTNEQA